MKLFQKLLLAPAALGLFAPMAVNATEANLNDVSNYSQVDVSVNQDTFKPLSSKNPLLAGGEGLGQDNLSNDFDVDSFSATTTASFTSNWVIGAVKGLSTAASRANFTNLEKVGATYDWGVELNTSFDGLDSLDVVLEGGEGGAVLTEMDLYESGDAVNVSSIAYTRNVGDYLTFYFSDGGAASALFNTACAYEGQTNALDDCANLMTGLDLGLGTAFAASVDVGNGLGVAIGVESENNSAGILTEEGVDAYAAQISWIQDNYGVSLTYANIENNDGATGAYGPALTQGDSTYRALNVFYQPNVDGLPSISGGIELGTDNFENDDDEDENNHYFVGLQFDEFGNGVLGLAYGTKEPTAEEADAETQVEAYYAYNYADGITITPVIYLRENDEVGIEDETGIVVKTTFEF